MKKRHPVLCALVLTLLISPSMAFGALSFCNYSSQKRVYISVGYQKDGNWWSKGWYHLGQSQCATPVGGDLPYRYYYFYAISDTGAEWTGDTEFCTLNSQYTILNAEKCGGSVKKFMKLDTEDYKNFTYNLTD